MQEASLDSDFAPPVLMGGCRRESRGIGFQPGELISPPYIGTNELPPGRSR